jgi:hypothetical protein
MPELDTTRAPRGVLAAQALVAAVAEQGDLAERHYLELKSTLDLSTKKDKEKIAKFILGAANRMPDVAAMAFEGYSVMIIGVAQGAVTGIPPVEMMEISKVIQKYVGAAGPRWDIVWVPVEGSTNQVLVIIVDPPKLGQGPFPCRASGDSLTDGRVYIRADGETREANSEELDLLIQRGSAGAQVEVDFAVEVLGEIASVTVDEENTVDEYLSKMRARLIDAMPRPEPRSTDAASLTGGLAGLSAYRAAIDGLSLVDSALMEPERRTEEEYIESIDRWESRFRAAWKAALSKIASSQLRPAVIRVMNRTTTFFHDVEVNLHLEGDIFAVDYSEPEWADDFSGLELPHPPRKWGPAQRLLGIPNYVNMSQLYTPGAMPYVSPSISYKNGGSVDLNLEVGELRPRGIYESEDEEIVLVVADRSLTSIRGTWELTARDHNDVYTGEIDVAVAGNRDLTAVARQILALEETVE